MELDTFISAIASNYIMMIWDECSCPILWSDVPVILIVKAYIFFLFSAFSVRCVVRRRYFTAVGIRVTVTIHVSRNTGLTIWRHVLRSLKRREGETRNNSHHHRNKTAAASVTMRWGTLVSTLLQKSMLIIWDLKEGWLCVLSSKRRMIMILD